ncbi:MAG: hypothetical protein AABZ74_14170 [Cyanobacteriota bacterium]
MEKLNKERVIIKILKEISKELNFDIEFLSYDWIVRIKNKDIIKHIVGYDWELNSSTSQLIAKDKNACFELLNLQKIPLIEHRLFLNPQFQSYIGGLGNWLKIMEFVEKNKYPIVCKSNVGTGGNEVFRANNQVELESQIHSLFSKHRSICLSPFYNIKNEYRIIILCGKPELIYSKQRPHVIGNGTQTILELINTTYQNISWNDFDLTSIDLKRIIALGECVELGWKHNLAKGSKAIIVEDSSLINKLVNLAVCSAKFININFASVDIVETEDSFLVMEINSGIMMESFAQQDENKFKIAKNIYKKALVKMMA